MTRRWMFPSACVVAAALVTGLAGCAHHHPATPAAGPAVSIVEPADGATVSSPFKLRFGVQGLAVAPAGDVVALSGHHHLLINVGPLPAGTSVPFTEQHLHFGKGQTETEVTLPPGTYKLTAQFANGAHQSYGPALSQTITVTVK
ncbi:DUF4399 domain-containing protein [Pseudaquabacterium pictum]|uniref:DUF4399 domain-containing protein n=1 Tax=Pseudaquabacterium pictum TaxID=2315236 RepID=A0A480AL84_9BURK|nr:DUF4399 domain-containing protein [Rubrivivax pictus]GCL61756.1 hypothetical protein AQPW35_08370 [Rubrivivax pictus]